MRLLQWEVNKMFRINRGIFIVLLFLLAETAVLLLGDTPVNPDAELYREQYQTWLESVEGPWTQEKASFLEETALGDPDSLGPGFDVLYKQYLYVNEGRENRWFMDTNGWASLLASRGLDIPLAAAILLLAVPVYCGEAACGMESLAQTTPMGKKLFLRDKLLLTLFITALLSLSSDLIHLLSAALRYGLPHGTYPMQSVESLGTAAKALSLWGAEALQTLFHLLGSLEFAIIALLLSALCSMYALAAFLSAAVLLLPWLGLDQSAQYALPLPLPSSLMMAAGYLQGSTVQTDAIQGTSVVSFQEISWGGIAWAAAGALLVCAVCVLLLRKRYQTAPSKDGLASGDCRKKMNAQTPKQDGRGAPQDQSVQAAAGVLLRQSAAGADSVQASPARDSAPGSVRSNPESAKETSAEELGAVKQDSGTVGMRKGAHESREERSAGRAHPKEFWKVAAVCAAVAVAVGLAVAAVWLSPAGSEQAPAETIYNSRENVPYVYGNLTVQARNGRLMVSDTAAGQESPLVRDALQSVSGTSVSDSFYGCGKYVYFWRRDTEGYGQRLSEDSGKVNITTLMRVNLGTMEDEVIFETVQQHTVLGLDVQTDDSLDILGVAPVFFADSRYLYVLSSRIRRVDLRTGELSALEIPTNHNVAFDGTRIYFISQAGILSEYNTGTGEYTALSKNPVQDFRLTENGLVF